MPYEMRGNCVHKVGNDKPMKCYDNKKDALAYLRALEANVPDANKEIDMKADSAPTNPADYAYVPDEKKPSLWKLRIDDREHVGLAIAALGPNPPHGKGAEIPAGDKGKVISRIRAAISKVARDDKDKAQMLADLAKVKSLETKAFQGLLDQTEVNYTPLSTTTGKACAACRWYMAQMDCCHLVEADPEPILPTGLCDRFEATPAPAMPDMPDPIPVMIVDPDDMGEMDMALPTTRRGLIDTIKDVVKSLLQAPAQDTPEAAFSVFKAADGKHYWLARHTGKFKDREGEIIADKAHEEYVQRVQKGIVPLPELWTWHTKGTRHGQADVIWKTGGFILALGHFDDTPEAKHAIAFYEKNAGKIKLSHMFTYPKSAKQKGIYHAYNTIEITTLPDGAEAFPYTSFEEIRSMTYPSEQREWIRGVLGDDGLKRVDTADAKAADDTKALEANGIESKGMNDFTGATIPAPQSEVEALKGVQFDIETRLKAVEGLPAQLKALTDMITRLTEQVTASQTAESQALAKVNALEKQLTELNDLKPPASQSQDTLLNARDKSFLDQVMTQAKVVDTPSLIDRLVGGQSTVATGV